MSTWSQLGFSDATSPIMEEFLLFHNMVMVFLTFITLSVGFLLGSLLFNKSIFSGLIEGQLLEWVWTLLPGVILLFVALPSLGLLYMYDESLDFSMTIKAVGHQWYWSYEYMDEVMSFDSFMESGINSMGFRLLSTDMPVVIPYQSMTQMLVTSKDVLHSWTVPSFGVKADAIPGRLNSLSLYSFRGGVFFGQCSEICGANHSFMPIMLEAISPEDFMKWLGADSL
nr:cytochrome c oxidase subunit II [Pennella sp. (in: crustaceans)]